MSASPARRNSFVALLSRVKPEIVFLLGQAWWLEPLLLVLQPYRSRLQIVNYMPIEGNLTDLEAARTVRFVDHCILYTEFARNNLSALCQRLEHQDSQFCAPKLHVLPHGVDTVTFWPSRARAWLVRGTALVWVSARNYFPEFRWCIQDS